MPRSWWRWRAPEPKDDTWPAPFSEPTTAPEAQRPAWAEEDTALQPLVGPEGARYDSGYSAYVPSDRATIFAQSEVPPDGLYRFGYGPDGKPMIEPAHRYRGLRHSGFDLVLYGGQTLALYADHDGSLISEPASHEGTVLGVLPLNDASASLLPPEFLGARTLARGDSLRLPPPAPPVVDTDADTAVIPRVQKEDEVSQPSQEEQHPIEVEGPDPMDIDRMKAPDFIDPTPAPTCPHCGAPVRTDSQLLADSLALVADRGADLIATFYGLLFRRRPDLRPLFPEDMSVQQEKLLGAVVTLAQRFDPDNDDAMDWLDQQLTAMGRAHTRFAPQPGPLEYGVVGDALLTTLADFAGSAWTQQYADAWRRAYWYAAGRMLAAQATHRAGGVGRRRR